MALHKNYRVVRSSNDEELEAFASLEAAEKFMIMMQQRGEQVTIKTDEEDEVDAPKTWDIEGLELETPSEDFGSDLDEFNDPGFFDNEEDSGIEFE